MGDFGIHLSQVAHEQKEAREQQSEGENDAELPINEQRGQHNNPSHQYHRLIAVAHGDVSADDPSQRQAERKCSKGCYEHNERDSLGPSPAQQADERKGEAHHEEHFGEGNPVV